MTRRPGALLVIGFGLAVLSAGCSKKTPATSGQGDPVPVTVGSVSRKDVPIQIIHGSLATTLGLPANTAFEVDIPQQEIPLQQGSEEVERLIADAQARRPDLAAARSLVLKSEAHLRQMKSLDRPFLSVNLNGAYYVTRSVLPEMRESRAGHLIYIASISGLTPDVSGASYQASKRGLIGLAHAIRFR